VIESLRRDNLALQFDCYHAQIMGGDLSWQIERHFRHIGHVQVAGAPARHEPDVGEIHYPALFELLDRLGYAGWVGCEYRPLRGSQPGGTSAGLGWMRRI
jgi:hydroxypyruvate isomerase